MYVLKTHAISIVITWIGQVQKSVQQIKDKLIDLIERTFQREGSPYLACNDRNLILKLSISHF